MELINSNVTLIEEQDLFKKIEIAGRTCYKSEDKITEGSAERFMKMLCNHRHTAMTEHATIYLTNPNPNIVANEKDLEFLQAIAANRFTTLNCVNNTNYITTNFRVIFEICNENLEDTLEFIKKFSVSPTEYHEKRYTFKIICDRGVSHELVRHRVFSFAQESTRYVNYNKKGMQFIIPAWWSKDNDNTKQIIFTNACKSAEECYNQLIALGQTPQQARAILPNCLKTEVVMTGTVSQWKSFLKLRAASDAHPDIQIIANKIQDILQLNY